MWITVVEGDTCQSIAALAGTDASTLQLWQQNFKENFDCADITLGQVLCVDVRKNDLEHFFSKK